MPRLIKMPSEAMTLVTDAMTPGDVMHALKCATWCHCFDHRLCAIQACRSYIRAFVPQSP